MNKESLKKVSIEPLTYKKEKKTLVFRFSRNQLCIPYGVFLALFVIFPLFLILYYAFTDKVTGAITFENFLNFFSNSTSITNLFISILLAMCTTVCCILIGYPVAYILARSNIKSSYILLLLFIMPMWINFVLRAMAMKELLTLLGLMGKYNFLNTLIGMVYDYLPFMILPLYTTLIKLDKSVLEAAEDLGASKVNVFTKVTLPLSLPGIVSGISMVFLPTMTCYVISDTFGSGKIFIIGKLIEEKFGRGSNWNEASAIALILLLIVFITMFISGAFKSEENDRGTAL